MKILIHTVVFCLFFLLSNAQVYFNNRYDLHTRADVAGSVFLHQGEYFVPCGGLDTTQINLSLSVMKVDLNGVVTNSSHYFKQNDWFYPAQIGKITPSNDSVLMYIGTRDGSGTSNAYTYWFKNNLDSVRYKEYGFPTKQNVVFRFVSDGVSNIYQVGYVDSSFTNADILLIKIDTSGNEIWKKNIGLTGWDEYGYNIAQCSNGDLLISGLKHSRTTLQQGPLIMRLDTSGNILWQNYYPSPNYANPAMDVMELPNGDIVFTGGKAYPGSINGYAPRKPTFTRVNATGNLIWQNEYGEIAGGHDFFTFLVNEKNNFVISGVKFYPFNTCVGMVYEINQNGDSLFSKEYLVGGGQNYFRDVIQAPDKGYVFAGFFIPIFLVGGTGTEDVWLLKTDSTFCEGFFNCGYPTGFASVNQTEAIIRVYPNPAKNILHIDFENSDENRRIEIYDAFGKLVLNEDILVQNSTFDIQRLISGIYFYKVVFGNKVIQSKLVIIK